MSHALVFARAPLLTCLRKSWVGIHQPQPRIGTLSASHYSSPPPVCVGRKRIYCRYLNIFHKIWRSFAASYFMTPLRHALLARRFNDGWVSGSLQAPQTLTRRASLRGLSLGYRPAVGSQRGSQGTLERVHDARRRVRPGAAYSLCSSCPRAQALARSARATVTDDAR